MEIKILGLRIVGAKPDYLEATVPLEQSKRPVAPEKDSRSSSDGSGSQTSDRSLLSSGVSSQQSTDNLRAEFWTIQSLTDEVQKKPSGSSLELKFRIMELAISDIGMGWHQWCLFVLCGLGWAADNLWLQGVALILPSLSADFGVSDQQVRYASFSLFVGLSLGAAVWGIGSDIVGRRLGFNSTLIITGIFALALANTQNFVASSGILGALGIGVGGSLPVDGTMLLEFLPHIFRRLLTLLSIWWPVGQVVTSLLAWFLLGGKFHPSGIRGWRIYIYSLGGITWVMALARLLFDSIESPKYLLGINKQADAVRSVRALAHKNGKKTWLTEDILNEIAGTTEIVEEVESSSSKKVRRVITSFGPEMKGQLSLLFETPVLGINTILVWFIWTVLGMGYSLFNAFLPQYLSNGHENEENDLANRNYLIISAFGLPGSILAWFLVHKVGRRYPMAMGTTIAGVSIFLFTARNEGTFQLACGCAASFFQNIMYGILYAYTPETFPGPSRGTGCGIAHSLSRLGGICAPLIAANVGAENPKIPIYISGSLILAGSAAMWALPIETKDKHTS